MTRKTSKIETSDAAETSIKPKQTKSAKDSASASVTDMTNVLKVLKEIRDNTKQKAEKRTKATSAANNATKPIEDNTKKTATLLHQINQTLTALKDMEGLSLSQKVRQKELVDIAKNLRDKAYSGENVYSSFNDLKLEQYKLEADRNRLNQGIFGLYSGKPGFSNGGYNVGTHQYSRVAAMLGVNPLAQQMLSQAVGFARKSNLFTPINWNKRKAVKNDIEENDNVDDGESNGTAELKSEKTGLMQSMNRGIYNLIDLFKGKGKEENGQEKEEEKGGILSFIMGTIGTVIKGMGTILGVAASGVVSLLALAGRDVVHKMLTSVLSGLGLSEEVASTLSGPVADALPGAILGFKLGGVKGAVIGGLISAGWFAIKRKYDEITGILNGNPVGKTNPLEDIMDGAIIGGMFGIPFGPPGMLIGALLGAAAGGIYALYKHFKSESEEAIENDKKEIEKAKAEGLSYSGSKDNSKAQEDVKNLKEQLEDKNLSKEDRKKAKAKLKYYKERTKEGLDYEEERASVQQAALKKYGTDDLSKLSFKQLKTIMYDDDAEFETFLTGLEKEGTITNDTETRMALRKTWQDNKDWFGENDDSKQAVLKQINEMMSKDMPTEGQILSDSNKEAAASRTETVVQSQQRIKDAVDNQSSESKVFNNISGNGNVDSSDVSGVKD